MLIKVPINACFFVIFWFIYMKNFEQFKLNFEKDKAKSSNYEEKKPIAQKKEKQQYLYLCFHVNRISI